ncbi:hypothetical protein GGI15_000607 [Coemansia interrupta]|uniref:GATA-type domain-containing protein n=1 Tax=Coemansia interrupta TaxID=1126814 RepID=A0A9W8HQT1_9FUNG|nr:hypothetical protein GGI15_000607 [Coemansia interrupta]
MAPILLKIKGTKMFSPFNEIEDVGDLSTLWRVCTKVKDSLENGSRLENLSWRLWHLHQTLEARGKGKDYRKLSPATTQQLEKTIRRPEAIRKAKPMQIKVRLGKSSGDRADTSPENGPAHGHGHHQQQNGARRKSSVSAANGTAGIGSAQPEVTTAGSENGSGTSMAVGAAHVASIGTQHSEGADVAEDTMPEAAASIPFDSSGYSDPNAVAEAAAASALTSLAPAVHAQSQADSQFLAHTAAAAQASASTSTPNEPAEGVQASDFMSFGPSSFLSSGFDLDAPQIEITLDDIFSASSGDWSQFGFPTLSASAPLGIPGAMGEYGSTPAIWGGVGYPGAMGTGFPTPAHMHGDHGQAKVHEGPICENCGVTSTPLWRRSSDDTVLCNACGLYYKLHNTHRPKSLRSNAARKDGAEDNAPKTVCTNCSTTNTPLWRRDEKNNPLCNACGLYYKLHKESRPITLKTDVIRKRQRFDASPSQGAPRKRQASRKQQQKEATASSGTSSESPAPGAAASASAAAGSVDSMGPPKPKARKSQSKAPAQMQTPLPSAIATDTAGEMQSQSQSPLQTQSQNTVPLTPLSAPPVSYSANGTQLLNSTDASGIPLQREHSLHSQEYSIDRTHSYEHGHPPYQRRHTTASEIAGIPAHHNGLGAAETHQPAPLQQSMTYHPMSHGTNIHNQQYQHAGQGNSSSSSYEPSASTRSLGASINIPMSPPLGARSDSYYARTQSSLQALPSLALSQTNSSSRHSAVSGGSTMLHSASSFQPMSGSGSAAGADPVARSGSANRRPSPMHISHTGAVASSSSIPPNDGGRMYAPDRLLPPLAEMAPSHPTDSFRFSRTQQPSYPSHP